MGPSHWARHQVACGSVRVSAQMRSARISPGIVDRFVCPRGTSTPRYPMDPFVSPVNAGPIITCSSPRRSARGAPYPLSRNRHGGSGTRSGGQCRRARSSAAEPGRQACRRTGPCARGRMPKGGNPPVQPGRRAAAAAWDEWLRGAGGWRSANSSGQPSVCAATVDGGTSSGRTSATRRRAERDSYGRAAGGRTARWFSPSRTQRGRRGPASTGSEWSGTVSGAAGRPGPDLRRRAGEHVLGQVSCQAWNGRAPPDRLYACGTMQVTASPAMTPSLVTPRCPVSVTRPDLIA